MNLRVMCFSLLLLMSILGCGFGHGDQQGQVQTSSAMVPYLDLSGRSGVLAYQTGPYYIKVKFKTSPKVYVYSYRRINPEKIEQMKRLALAGQGLNGFINRNPDVRYGFELE